MSSYCVHGLLARFCEVLLYCDSLMMILYRIETCSSVQRDIVILNIWKQYSAFCWTECCELIIECTE
jgi:hypothetical protein